MPEFTFLLRVPDRELTDAEVGALYEGGLDDAGIETGPAGTLLDVTRAAPSRQAAADSAIAQVRAVLGSVPVVEDLAG